MFPELIPAFKKMNATDNGSKPLSIRCHSLAVHGLHGRLSHLLAVCISGKKTWPITMLGCGWGDAATYWMEVRKWGSGWKLENFGRRNLDL